MPANVQIQFRRDSKANWSSINPTLALAEPGIEEDTGLLKIGDGTSPWGSLSYIGTAGAYKGAWSSVTNYQAGALVGSMTSVWLSLTANVNVPPGTNAGVWVSLGMPTGMQATPTTATYDASYGDLAAVTLGTTTSAVLPAIAMAGNSTVFIAIVGGSGTLTITTADSSLILSSTGLVASMTMTAVGQVINFQALSNNWVAH